MSGPIAPPPGEPHRVRNQQNKGFAQSVAFSAARGALLIGVAVIIGIVLLQVVDNDTTGPIGDGGRTAAASTNSSTTTTTAPAAGSTTSTTAAVAAKPPAEISVQALNGGSVSNAAGTLTTKLKSAGYVTLVANDTTKTQGTTVYCTGGLQREAAALAAAVGGSPPPAVKVLPSPLPNNADPSANCVVVIGS